MPAARTLLSKRRREHADADPRIRALTASAERIDLRDPVQTRKHRALRQGWQLEAWAYRDSIPELRYGINFLANCAARMRLFPAAYLPDANESDLPVPLKDVPDIPDEVVQACESAMIDLGNGRLAIAALMHSLSTNHTVAGEEYLLGQEDPESGDLTWAVRSIDELVIYADEWRLREVPSDPQGILGWVKLDPALTVVTRMWQPHPRYRLLADSPLRAMIDDLESLTILRRSIRAVGRSRIAARGLLLVPTELSIKVPLDDEGDPEADPFTSALTRAFIEPIGDEGVASAVVPVLIRGPGDALEKVRLVELASTFDEMSIKVREELVGVAATGLDLPKEVIIGIADLNHWSAWQVDDNTFRHHVEPHVIELVECLTASYLRPYFAACGLDEGLVNTWTKRLVLWYDPTELVTPPDMSASAQQAHTALAISDEAYRRNMGFTEADAPTPGEIEVRMIRTTRTYPPNLLMALMHELDPNLVVPPMAGPPALPGIKAGGVVSVIDTSGAESPASEDAGGAEVDADEGPTSPVAGPPPSQRAKPETIRDGVASARAAEGARRLLAGVRTKAERDAVLRALRVNLTRQLGHDPFAARSAKPTPTVPAPGRSSSARKRALSKRMVSIESDLRSRLVVAANAAMLRHLEKAGTRLRAKMSRNPSQRERIAHTRAELIPATLGHDGIAAAGYTSATLTNADAFETFRAQFYEWVPAAQEQMLRAAVQLGGLATDDEALALAARKLAIGVDKAWATMSDSLSAIAQHLLTNASLDPAVAIEDFNPSTLVPTGVVRAALGVAGGATPQDFGLVATADGTEIPAIPLGAEVGQMSTAGTIGDLLSGSGQAIVGYEWEHGPALNPFEPHEDLNGEEFESWTADILSNDTGFPDNDFFFPGDHTGCTCDFSVIWGDASDADTSDDSGDDDSGE